MLEKTTHRDASPYYHSNKWRAAACVNRPFVKFADSTPAPGTYHSDRASNNTIRLTVVIPTLDGDRNGYLSNLLAQIRQQSFNEYEVLVIKGDPRQGRALNIGAALAEGQYFMTLDDDTSIPDPFTFEKLIAVLENYPNIGIAGGNNLVPDDANPFVRRAMKEIPRRSWKMVSKITESDLAEHPCLMMRTAEFKEVGGENELIPRGLDPYLRMIYRESGRRVVVVPDVIYHHLPPDCFSKLIKQFLRNGMQAAYVNRYFPQWAIETPANHGPFINQKPFVVRFCRYSLRMLHALCAFKPILLLSEIAYAFGFLCGMIIHQPKSMTRLKR